jgi:hypothetical protein
MAKSHLVKLKFTYRATYFTKKNHMSQIKYNNEGGSIRKKLGLDSR